MNYDLQSSLKSQFSQEITLNILVETTRIQDAWIYHIG